MSEWQQNQPNHFSSTTFLLMCIACFNMGMISSNETLIEDMLFLIDAYRLPWTKCITSNGITRVVSYIEGQLIIHLDRGEKYIISDVTMLPYFFN
jgi:hypothetical protein